MDAPKYSKEKLAESQKKIDSAMGKNDPTKGIREAYSNIKGLFGGDKKDDSLGKALNDRRNKIAGAE